MDFCWNTIGILTDETVLGTGGYSNRQPQRKVRAILVREDGKIAVMHEKKTGLYALPGGGIEAGEDETAALYRELFEETGCSCDAVEPLGIVSENRYHTDATRLSYFFIVHTKSKAATPHFTKEELALGTSMLWYLPEEALQLIRTMVCNTPQMKFLQARDLAALCAYISRLR